MEQEPGYYSPKKNTSCQFTVRGSRFIGTMAPVNSEILAGEIIATAADLYPDATHHAYAYRIGEGNSLIERVSDDREPSGSAGIPMLQVLQGRNVSDAVVIGTRYFGGVKLGIGGLTRAYRDCARQSLSIADLTWKEPLEEYLLKFDYKDLGPVTRLLDSLQGSIVTTIYGDTVVLRAIIAKRFAGKMVEGFQSACRGSGNWSLLE